MSGEARRDERVRAAEVIGALCLTTDFGMGFPFEHGLQSAVIAMRLTDRLGVDPATASQTYYASLLSHAGCTTDAHVTPRGLRRFAHDSVPPRRVWGQPNARAFSSSSHTKKFFA